MTPSPPFTVLSTKTVLVRRKRRRAKEQLQVPFRAPIMLDCPARDEFPLAVRVHDATRSSTEQIIEYRNFGGRIFTPVLIRFANGRYRNFPARLVGPALEGSTELIDSGTWNNPFLQKMDRNDSSQEPLRADIVDVVFDGEEERIGELNRIASRYLIYSGLLWVETEEPVYLTSDVSSSWGDRTIALDWHPERARSSERCAPLCFRLDRLEFAKEFLRLVAHREGIVSNTCLRHFDASLLVRDDRLQAARALANATVTQVRIRWLKLLDPAGAAVLIRLKELGDSPMATADAIGRLAGRMLKTLHGLDLNEHGHQALAATMTMLRPALLRWTEIEGGQVDGEELSENDLGLLAELG